MPVAAAFVPPAVEPVPPPAVVPNFPPPVGKFPPPPGAKKPSEGAPEKVESAAKPAGRKKLLLIGGGVLGVAMLGAGYFLFLQSPAEPPLPPPKRALPAVVANPTSVPGQAVSAAQTAVAKANEQMAPLNEAIAADQPAVGSAPVPEPATVAAAAPPPVEVAEIDRTPIPPSVAFREWVANLRIGSVRTGAKPRILLDRTSYDVGDTVNQQLGITFEGYNPDTRMIIFKDRSGAIVERRN